MNKSDRLFILPLELPEFAERSANQSDRIKDTGFRSFSGDIPTTYKATD